MRRSLCPGCSPRRGIGTNRELPYFLPFFHRSLLLITKARSIRAWLGLPAQLSRLPDVLWRYPIDITELSPDIHVLLGLRLPPCSGGPITVYGDGKQVRDVLWIDDLINLYERAIERIDVAPEVAAGRIYNAGGGASNTMSLLEL